MKKHEKRCTNNPDRECGMCREKRDYRKLVFGLADSKELKWLREEVEIVPLASSQF
jgi:hypothetical protein